MAASSGSSRKPKTPKEVDIVVVVNHEDLRRGERGVVELTETVQRRLDAGYLRLADTEGDDPDLPLLGTGVGRPLPTIGVQGGGERVDPGGPHQSDD